LAALRSAQRTPVCRDHAACGLGPGAPALLALAAGAGAFTALGGHEAGVAGAGAAPVQAELALARQDGVVAVIRATRDKGAQRTELRLDRVAQDALADGKHSSTVAP
jgi:hypothetical protein